MIDNCEEQNIQPCSVDLRLGSLFITKAKGVVDIEQNPPKVKEVKLPYIIKPGEFILGKTIESMNQKHTKYGAIAVPRSRAFRMGLHIMCGLVHPYYKGECVFGIKNLSENRIRLSKGMSLLQLCFFEIKSDCVPLKHRYQNGRLM